MKPSPAEQAEAYALTHTDVRQAFLDGYGAALKSRSKKKELDLSFVPPAFRDVMEKWLAYKKERKCAYTQRGAESACKLLLRMSGGDPRTADLIVEQSIANNWQGLFQLKSNGTQSRTTSPGIPRTVAERRESVAQLVGFAGEMLRRIGGGDPARDGAC